MSSYYGPGPQPGPGGDGPPPSGTGVRTFGLAAMALLLVATVVSFAVTRSSSNAKSGFIAKSSYSTLVPLSATFPSTGGFSATLPSAPSSTSGPTGGFSTTPPPAPSSTSGPTGATPAPSHTTPPVQMSAYGVRNVLYLFFDGFLYHRLSDVRAAVCPKYRYLYNGTYTIHPKGYEFQKWRSSSYTLYPGRTYVDIYVAVTLRYPSTGAVGKTWNHTWVIVLQNKKYYVCGTRS
jgi:hypothetical protein